MNDFKGFSRIFTVFIILFMISACATIWRGTKKKVQVNSNPQGAEIWLNGTNTGLVTPAKVTVKRKGVNRQQSYVLRKPGFEDYSYSEGRKITLFWIIPDIGFGVLPLFVDLFDGALYNYNRKIKVDLAPRPGPIEQSPVQAVVPIVIKGKMEQAPVNLKLEPSSDVDLNIPEIGNEFPYRFALIIGNEDYSSFQNDLNSEVNVSYAHNDAKIFREYVIKTMGVPETNAILLLDATLAQMNQAITKMNLLIKNSYGKAEIIFYYAGHGLPDEETKDPYLIPVDVSGSQVASGIALNSLYSKLTEYPCKRISVFLDACFSGGSRDKGLISARGVKVKPKDIQLNGNLVVFSASSGDQSSLPYHDKKHGLFTYLLLKKLQQTRGDISYEDLSQYLREEIGLKSVLINNKEQNSQVATSPMVGEDWKNWKLNE